MLASPRDQPSLAGDEGYVDADLGDSGLAQVFQGNFGVGDHQDAFAPQRIGDLGFLQADHVGPQGLDQVLQQGQAEAEGVKSIGLSAFLPLA